MRSNIQFLAATLLATGFTGTHLMVSAADKPQYTVKEVMKAVHKGDDALARKVTKGEGTPDDYKKLVVYYIALPLNEAPKGDAASWKEKTTALLLAAQALEAGKPGALDQYKTAVNCKACHSVHKPD
jgi:hypothetical protein